MDNYAPHQQADVEYKTLDRGVPAWAIKPGPAAVPPIPAVPGSTDQLENFEGVLWSQITFDTGDWAVDTAVAHSPTHSFRSKVIGNNQTTSFTIQNSSFLPQLSFWVETNTENNFDFFKVFIDSVEVYSESGSHSMHRVAIPTNFGFSIEFRYSKDFSSAPPGDGVWVDDIVFGSLDIPAVPGAPAHPFIYTPLKMTTDGERLKVDASFAAAQHVIVDSIPEVEIKNDAGNPVPVNGTVNIGSMPEVEIKNDVGNPVPVSGTVSATQGTSPWVVGVHGVTQSTSPWVVSGTVNIGTIPEVEIKNDAGNPVPVNGTVNIGTMPEVEIKNDTGNPVPVTMTVTGTLANGAETSVAGSAVQVLAANTNRRKVIVQNTGLANVRIGVTGVTATTGMRLVPNGHLLLEMPNCPTQAIFAIREGAVSSTVFAQEIT